MSEINNFNSWDIIVPNDSLKLFSKKDECIIIHDNQICLSITPTKGAENMVNLKIGDITISVSGEHKAINVSYK